MRQSQLFTKVRKEAPKDEVAKNAQLLIRAGYIHKEMAGVYSLLPLGLRVIKKIEGIIREEMNAIGGQEMEMSALQNRELWEKTDRWNIDEVWFKTTLNGGGELGLGFTHEEPLTNIAAGYVNSYKDLPFAAYQFQTKFRNELRAKSGIMRGREFVMKDLYSFSRTPKEHQDYYDAVAQTYDSIFNRVGIGELTYKTFASGGSFAQFSHEYQTITDAGEDTIYVDERTGVAVNEEVLKDEVLSELGLNKDELVAKKAIEVGNIFSLGTKFSEPLGLVFVDENEESHPVIMGSYGIGLGRLMGTVAEVLSDDKGLVWPESIAPFGVHLVALQGGEDAANKLYETLMSAGIDVLYDDRNKRPGEKFADSDMIGIPMRVVVSEKTIAAGKLEVKDRTTGEVTMMSENELIDFLKK